jgi:hypothetical protein
MCITIVKHILVLWVVKKMFVDKETINCQLNILLELDKLLSDFDDTLIKAILILSYSVPFYLEN